jgi:hypothetical protein
MEKEQFLLSSGILVDVLCLHVDYGAGQAIDALKLILPRRDLFIGDTGNDCDITYYIADRELTPEEVDDLKKQMYR